MGSENSEGTAHENPFLVLYDNQTEGNRAANKNVPLAHRCLSLDEFRNTDVLESLLDRPREVTMVSQSETKGFGEGIDLGLNYLLITVARDEALADRVELVSGRGDSEAWKETNAAALPQMFKTFRKELASELTKRFQLDTTPSKHVLLALKMNPSIDTSADSSQMLGKAAKQEMATSEYIRALRRQAIRLFAPPSAPDTTSPAPGVPVSPVLGAPAPAPADSPAPSAAALPPPGKRRKGLMGVVAKQQSAGRADDDETSRIDNLVKAEMDRFETISMKILAQVVPHTPHTSAHPHCSGSRWQGTDHELYEGTSRFNLRKFWAGNKSILPIHFAVFMAEVGCKRAAAANVESVFSGAGKFSAEVRPVALCLL